MYHQYMLYRLTSVDNLHGFFKRNNDWHARGYFRSVIPEDSAPAAAANIRSLMNPDKRCNDRFPLITDYESVKIYPNLPI